MTEPLASSREIVHFCSTPKMVFPPRQSRKFSNSASELRFLETPYSAKREMQPKGECGLKKKTKKTLYRQCMGPTLFLVGFQREGRKEAKPLGSPRF